MARLKSPLATVIILALVLVLLYALNPTTADFQAWRSAKAENAAGEGTTSGLVGVMKKGPGEIPRAMTAIVSGTYERGDFLVFSTYSPGGERGDLYLGIARLFIRLK